MTNCNMKLEERLQQKLEERLEKRLHQWVTDFKQKM